MKEELLRFLMQHYAKYKTSQDGASMLIETDLAHFDEQFLRFGLEPNDAQPEI